MEPPNNGQVETKHFVLYIERLSSLQRLQMYYYLKVCPLWEVFLFYYSECPFYHYVLDRVWLKCSLQKKMMVTSWLQPASLHLTNSSLRNPLTALSKKNSPAPKHVNIYREESLVHGYTLDKDGLQLSSVQWNLRTRDTLGQIVLSLVERLSLSRR